MTSRPSQASGAFRPWLWLALGIPLVASLVWLARSPKVAEPSGHSQGATGASPARPWGAPALELPYHVYNSHLAHLRVVPDGSAILAFGSEGAALRSVDDGQSWQPLSMPTREFLTESVANPASDVIVVIGGGGTILRSTDQGQNFVAVRVDTERSFRSIAWSSSGAREILAVGDSGLAYVSRDAGQSFAREETPRTDYLSHVVALPKRDRFVVGGDNGALLVRDPGGKWRDVTGNAPGLGKESGLVMALDLLASGRLLASTQNGAIVSSDDDGETFREVDKTGSDSFVAAFEASDSGALVTARLRRGELLLSRDQGSTFASTSLGSKPGVARLLWQKNAFIGFAGDGGVLSSDASGAHWSSAPSALGEAPLAMAIHPLTGTVLAVGRSGLIARSTDRGKHFQVVSQGLNGSLRAFVDNSPAGCWVGVGMAATIVRSTDSGKSWQRVPLTIPRQIELTSVAVEPKAHALLAAGGAGTLLRSTDCARTWSQVNATKNDLSFIEAGESSTLLALAVQAGVLRSSDGGIKFLPSEMEAGSTLRRAVSISASEWVTVGDGGRAYRSGDDGRSFQRVSTGSEANLRALGYDRAHRTLWAAGDSGVVLRSTDAGASWTRVAVPSEENLFVIGLHPQGQVVWIGGNRGTALRSTDQGEHFENVPSGSTQTLRVIAFDPVSKEFLMAGAAGTLLRTVSGARIAPIKTTLEGRIDAALFHAPSGAWFLGGERLVRLGGG